MSNYDYERKIFGYLEKIKNYSATRPLNLGGVAGGGGGSGGPPGGFIGRLPQSRVAFDTDEFEVFAIPSGASLLDNLNRIRYRLARVEASGVGGAGSVGILDDGIEITDHVTSIDFIGGTVTHVGNDVSVTLGAGAGDMVKTTYDTDNDGIVDNSEQLQGHAAAYFALSSHNHAATEITSGTINTARLGTGVADSSTFLRGDNTWVTVSGISSSGVDILAVQVFS